MASDQPQCLWEGPGGGGNYRAGKGEGEKVKGQKSEQVNPPSTTSVSFLTFL